MTVTGTKSTATPGRAQRALRLVEGGCVAVSALALVVMGVLMVLEVVLRYVVGAPLSWSLGFITDYLLVGMFFLGLAYTSRVGGHVSIDVVFQRLPRRARHLLDRLGQLLALLFFGLLFFAGSRTTVDAWLDGEIPPPGGAELSWPTWTSYVLAPLGIGVLLLRIAQTILSPYRDEES